MFCDWAQIVETITPITANQADILNTLRSFGESHALDEENLLCTHLTLAQLSEWQAPVDLRLAALCLPWATSNDIAWQEIVPFLNEEIRCTVAAWRNGYRLTAAPTDIQGSENWSVKLRKLMRDAYLNLESVVLAVTNHATRIRIASSQSANLSVTYAGLWRETEEVFVPLMAMLGMWQLRREWSDISAKYLHADKYTEYQEGLKQNAKTRQKCFDHVQQQLIVRNDRPSLIVQMRETTPGTILYRAREGESLDELYTRITIDVFVDTEADCYLALGLANRLGLPVQGRLQDYMAQSQPNGYRAIHTAIAGLHQTPGCQNMLIEFRICSHEMNVLNQLGIIAAKYLDPALYSSRPTWWNKITGQPEIINLLKSQDIDERATSEGQPIYVFTPRGEVKILPAGSTALDFAYRLHTQIGHHCRAVYINHQPATHDAVLINGALINLKQDPFFRGPDPAWLHIARNRRTREKIKRGLGAIAQSIHPGRRLIDRLLKAISDESGFVIPEPRLDKYLAMAAETYRLGNVQNLYSALVTPEKAQSIALDRIVMQILEAELSSAVVDRHGVSVLAGRSEHVTLLQAPMLRFCASCKPLPGVPLVLHRRIRRNREVLTLHRADTENAATLSSEGKPFGLPSGMTTHCLRQLPSHELDYAVRWGEVATNRQVVNLTVLARDHPGLVGDLLALIYRNQRLNLIRIEASADREHTADVFFTLECDSIHQVSHLRGQIETLSEVIRSATWPVTAPQSSSLRVSRVSRDLNPYSSGDPVRDGRMLFGREREIAQFKDRLNPDRPVKLLTLHGQRRSGKTSLALMLDHGLRSLPIRCVYVDLQRVRDEPSAVRVYREIGLAAQKALFPRQAGTSVAAPVELPTLVDFRVNPSEFFFRYLDQLQTHLAPQRLLIMLDEFNLLVEEGHSSIFSQLRATTTTGFPGITLLLITHTSHYRLPGTQAVRKLYEQGPELELPMLDRVAAGRLIKDPLQGYLRFDDEVVNQIVTGTGGNPYLINLLCYDLVHRLNSEGRDYVRPADLEQAVHTLLRNGETSFSFLTDYITGATRVLVADIARQQRELNGWTPLAPCALTARLRYRQAEEIVRRLNGLGVLDVRAANSHSLHVRIATEYFARWVNQVWSPELAGDTHELA